MKTFNSIEVARLLKTWFINLKNSLALVLTWGKRVYHEGRYRNGVWSNWSRAHSCRPAHYFQPTTEQEICQVIAAARKIRVVGGGHSFNDGALSDDTLLSLDQYRSE